MEEVKLSDIFTMKYGKMPKKDLISSSGYPIFSGYRIVGYYPEYNLLDSEVIVVARGVGGTGDVKLTPPKCYLTNLSIVLKIINENRVDKKYIFYKLNQSRLRELDSGSAQSQITINDLETFRIKLPSIQTQRKIASILSAYDDLIDNNTRRIKILEEMAQAIYKEWFVNFHFPNHEKVKFVDSELGKIPEGWEVVPLENIC